MSQGSICQFIADFIVIFLADICAAWVVIVIFEARKEEKLLRGRSLNELYKACFELRVVVEVEIQQISGDPGAPAERNQFLLNQFTVFSKVSQSLLFWDFAGSGPFFLQYRQILRACSDAKYKNQGDGRQRLGEILTNITKLEAEIIEKLRPMPSKFRIFAFKAKQRLSKFFSKSKISF
jgi:hypothetical protein